MSRIPGYKTGTWLDGEGPEKDVHQGFRTHENRVARCLMSTIEMLNVWGIGLDYGTSKRRRAKKAALYMPYFCAACCAECGVRRMRVASAS